MSALTLSTPEGINIMAQKEVLKVVDDIDGSDAEETVLFGLDGVHYEIDLSQYNAQFLRDTLELYVENGRRLVRKGTKVKRGSRTSSPREVKVVASAPVDREQSRAIREWAKRNNFTLSDRGRIPNAVLEAYESAGKRRKRRTAA